MAEDPSERITIHPLRGRIRIRAGERLIADSRRALELRERGYPAVHYLPREDVDTDSLRRSTTSTHCPFKGDACYFTLELEEGRREDVAWSYESPLSERAAIAGHLAFDPREVEIEVER